MWRSRHSGKNTNRPCGDGRPRPSGGANAPRDFRGRGARATQDKGNGKGSRNFGKKSRDDTTLRFAGRGASGDGVASWTLCGHAAQVADERWILLRADWLG